MFHKVSSDTIPIPLKPGDDDRIKKFQKNDEDDVCTSPIHFLYIFYTILCDCKAKIFKSIIIFQQQPFFSLIRFFSKNSCTVWEKTLNPKVMVAAAK